MLHLQSTNERRIGLDHDAVFLAERSDVGPGIEWMDLDLIHNREYTRFRGEEFFELCYGSVMAIFVEHTSATYVLDSKVADASRPDFTRIDCILDRLP